MRRRPHSVFILLAALAAMLSIRGDAESATTITLPADFSDALVASIALPTALAFTPDGRLLITTQPGQLRVYQSGALVSTPALDLNTHPTDICTTSERGLLGVEVDPSFASNGYIYLYWSAGTSGNCRNRVSRFTMTGNTASLGSESILVDNIPAPLGTHNAGDVHVGKDGNLYVSVGDGGEDYAGGGTGTNNDAARDMHALVGKILRITRDGGIPADNPFQDPVTSVRCNTTGTTSPGKQCREIFATGLRNPFRIAFDPNAAGVKFHINDVGQNHWEEIDLGTSGADYGWNVREGPCVRGSTTNCGTPPAGMTNPIFSYQQGDPSGCRAITGGAFVPAGIWPSQYDDAYLYADYVCGKIFRLDPQTGGGFVRTEFATALGSNSAVSMIFGPYQGTQALYYTTYEASGSVRRIAYTGAANRVPTAAVSASPTSGPAPLQVNFDGGGSSDPDTGDTLTYLWDFGDGATTEGSSPTISHTYTATGTFTASLRVRDNHGALSMPATRTIQPGNTAPTPVINTPAGGARFRVDETVVLNGSATDPQEGSLPASSLRWRVLRHHGASHTHPWLPETAGNNISISTPVPEDLDTTTTSFLEVILTATDSAGLSSTVTREFRPRLVDLTFVTEPTGLSLQVNGEPITGPRTFSSWEAWTFPVAALRQQDGGGATWVFDHWSDGGAATHNVTTGAAPATHTATFRPNATPVATGSSVSTPEDTAGTIVLAASDADGDAITRAISRSPANGTLGAITGANVVYTPTAQTNGGDSFEFTASDGAATSAAATVSITVTEVNDPPDAVNDTTSVAEDGSVLVNVRSNDTKGPANESGQSLTVSSVTTAPLHGTATVEAGSVRYQPAANYFGPDSFGYQVCDDGTTNGSPASLCDSATVTVTVTSVNDAPVAVDDATSVAEDGSVLINVRANDTDVEGNPLTVTAATPGAETNGTVVLSGGDVRYTPTANFSGVARFDYTVSDGAGGTDTGTVVVNVTPVNDAPTAVDDVRAATEDTAATFTGASLAANDTDLDGGALTVTAVSPRADTNGTVGLSAGQVTYTPAANFNGVAQFDYTVSDGAGGTDIGTVRIDVAAVNDAPVAGDDTAGTPVDTAIVIDVLANDSPGPADEQGQALTIATVGAPSNGTAVAETGRVRYTPAPGYIGPASFTYQVCDNGSGAPCDTATVSVEVTPTNRSPVAVDDTATVAEDGSIVVPVRANDTDPDSNPLTVTAVTPGAQTNGTVGLSAGQVTYTPAANFSGEGRFDYTISDGAGGTDVGSVVVTVTPVNDAPVAVDDVRAATEDTPATFEAASLAANDTDVDGAALTVTAVTPRADTNGSVGLAGGQVSYTPAANFSGAARFDYTVSDSAGGTDTGTVVVNVTPVNDVPVAVDDVRAATEDTAATFSAASLAANDTDIDGGALTITAVSVRADTNGTVGLSAGQVTYTPAGNFNGVARFDYTVSDGAGGTDAGMVRVDVAAVNDPPTAADDTAATSEATAVVVDVLANDSPGPADESGQALTLSTIGTPAHGTAVPDAGKVRYTPAPGYSGPDEFTYAACDNGPLCDSALVAVNVGEVNSPPIATDVVATALEDIESRIDLAGSDPEGAALIFAVVTPPAHGSVVGIAGRVLRYLPAPNYHGDDSLTFRVSDGALESDVATVSLTVHAVNDQPAAASDVVLAGTDAPVLVDVLGNDSTGPADELTQTLRIAGVDSPQHGSAAVAGGRILYTPSPTHNGPDTFAYSVCDDGRTGGLPDPRCAVGKVDFAFSALPLPVNGRAPRVVGGSRAGTVAVALVGEWTAVPVAVGYRWLRCASRGGCVAVAGATGSRYQVRLADVGKALRVAVTMRNRFGEAAATSSPTAAVKSPVEIAAVRHRGKEWVLLRNETRASVSMSGWTLRDAGGAVHPLGRTAIRSLGTLRVGTPSIWNARDRVTLRLPGGRIADSCAYAARAAVARC